MSVEPEAENEARGAEELPVCKRPGCGNRVPQKPGRGRPKMFCSTSCASAFHNSSRVRETGSGPVGDPLAELEPMLRQAVVMAKAAREQAEGLDPAKVRVEIADAEAARRRAEAAVVTAEARQAEAESETEALGEALDAAREDKTAAEEKAVSLAAELEEARREADKRVAAVTTELGAEVDAVRVHASQAQEELGRALERPREIQAVADAEIARARQAEADARQEVRSIRDDAARERQELKAACDAQLKAQQALTEAERARAERAEGLLELERSDRRQLITRLAPGKDGRVASTVRGTSKKPVRPAPASATAGTE